MPAARELLHLFKKGFSDFRKNDIFAPNEKNISIRRFTQRQQCRYSRYLLIQRSHFGFVFF